MSKLFSVERPIRFSHCDPADIVYFAHFFDMFNAAVEELLSKVVYERELRGGVPV